MAEPLRVTVALEGEHVALAEITKAESALCGELFMIVGNRQADRTDVRYFKRVQR